MVAYSYNNLIQILSTMKESLKADIKGQKSKTKPMNEMIFQSIMGEYLIDPAEYYEKQSIRRAYLLNDEAGLRRILETEY